MLTGGVHRESRPRRDGVGTRHATFAGAQVASTPGVGRLIPQVPRGPDPDPDPDPDPGADPGAEAGLDLAP